MICEERAQQNNKKSADCTEASQIESDVLIYKLQRFKIQVVCTTMLQILEQVSRQ